MDFFYKPVVAAAIALAGSLCFPGIATAGTAAANFGMQQLDALSLGRNRSNGVDFSGPNIGLLSYFEFRQFLNQIPVCDFSHRVVPDTFDGGSARAPVWTEELGLVDLDQYTREELDQMVHDYWTPERMRNELSSSNDVHFYADVSLDDFFFPMQHTKEEVVQRYLDYWTPERISNADTATLVSISEQYRAMLNAAAGPLPAVPLPFPFDNVSVEGVCVFHGSDPAVDEASGYSN